METLRDEKWADMSGRHGDWARDAALRRGRRVGCSLLIQIADLAGVIDYAAVSQAALWRTPGQRVKTAPAHGTITESIVECFDLTLRLFRAWHAGPARAWPPTDLVEFVIDEIDEKLFEPEVKEQREVNLVNGLVAANMPTFSDVGQPAKRDIPTKFCWW